MQVVLCELYNPYLHGFSDYKKMFGQYIIICSNNTDLDETDSEMGSDTSDEEEEEEDQFNETLNAYKIMYAELSDLYRKNKYIRNYANIISRDNYIRPEIAERIVLPSGHIVAILKTFYIRIIQRVWKKVYKARMNRIMETL